MAKKADDVSRSQQIRDYLMANPSATPKSVIEALRQRGVLVSESLVNQIKYKSPGYRSKLRRAAMGSGRAASTNPVSVDDLVSAKQIVDRMGGVDRAKEALDLYSRLR